MIRDVTEALFVDQMKRVERLVVVEWWSPSCSVCKEMAPIYEAVAKEMEKEALFLRINTDANNRMAFREGITGTPTFSFYCREGKVGEIIGMTSATMLRNTIRDKIRYHLSCPGRKKVDYGIDGYG